MIGSVEELGWTVDEGGGKVAVVDLDGFKLHSYSFENLTACFFWASMMNNY